MPPDGSCEPMDPVSALISSALSLHELFLALCAAGYSEQQALFMQGVMLANAGNRPTND